MANNYFRFKEFTINQDKCAMKVCTDACLFGAWAADKFSPSKVLDIGAGTGLLSLMLAQKSNAVIDAVEIDENAYIQAGENFAASPWKERLKVFNSPVQDFKEDKYDLIISNPPFFKNDLKSPDTARNIALHSEVLSLEELLAAVKRLLSEKGKFVVLLPFHRATYFEELARQNELFIEERLVVNQTPEHQPFRICYLVSQTDEDFKETFITIKNSNEQYTFEFKKLLKDYYLQMKKEIVIENDIEFVPAHNLKAGNIELLYESGRVRYIKYRDEEILRMIYPALRAEDWATVNGVISNEKIEKGDNSFHITFEMQFNENNINYKAAYEITCSNDKLEYVMNGESLSDFKSKRVGLCVHHPIDSCSGREVSILHPEGKKGSYRFPEFISPVWPFTDIITMNWNTGSAAVEVAFEGDLFETEDQRNWTDDSYKTYSGPQYKTPMLDIRTHDKMKHKVVLSAVYMGKSGISEKKAVDKKHVFPKIGYQRSSGQQKLTENEITQLKNIPFDHYKVELHLKNNDWKDILNEFIEEAILLNTKLELAVYFYNEGTDDLINGLENVTEHLDCLHILSETSVVPESDRYKNIYNEVKKRFPDLKTGYGNSGWFADINSVDIENIQSDMFSFMVSPQVHQSDNRSILENLGSQHSTIDTLKHRVEDRSIYVSPIVFNSREDDERLKTKFAAWWTINTICNFSEAGHLTFYELTGPRGILGSAIYNLLKSIKGMNPGYIYKTNNEIVIENSDNDCLIFKNSVYE